MDQHPILGEVGILLVASCYRNRDKLQSDGPLGSYANLSIPVNNAVTILPTIFLTNLAENDEYVPCAGEINMNCYTAGVSDWRTHSSYFSIHLDHAKCFKRETPKCNFPIQRHINAVVQEFSKQLKVYEPLDGRKITKIKQ